MKVELIERYLTKEMPPEERELFEKEMENDPSLKFDVQLVACVIRSTRKVYLQRDREMVARMLQSKPQDKKRYVTIVAAMFAVTIAAVACLLFYGYSKYKENQEEQASSVSEQKDKRHYAEFLNIEEGNNGIGDKMEPISLESPYMEQERDNRHPMGSRGDIEVDSSEPSQGGVVNEAHVSPADQPPAPPFTEYNNYTYFPNADSVLSVSNSPSTTEKAYLSSCQVGGLWGAVERAFMLDKKSLQVEVVLNSKQKNTDVGEETFRFKTHLITDAGKKKTLYDFKYGNTSRTSFFLEKGSMVHISLYFRGFKEQPTSLRELRIPALHQDFVFRNIAIN